MVEALGELAECGAFDAVRRVDEEALHGAADEALAAPIPGPIAVAVDVRQDEREGVVAAAVEYRHEQLVGRRLIDDEPVARREAPAGRDVLIDPDGARGERVRRARPEDGDAELADDERHAGRRFGRVELDPTFEDMERLAAVAPVLEAIAAGAENRGRDRQVCGPYAHCRPPGSPFLGSLASPGLLRIHGHCTPNPSTPKGTMREVSDVAPASSAIAKR